MNAVEPLADMILLAGAALGAAMVWFRSSIFARRRATYEARDDWLAELMTCRFCFTCQTALWLGLGLLLPSYLTPAPWHEIIKLPLLIGSAFYLIGCVTRVDEQDQGKGEKHDEV